MNTVQTIWQISRPTVWPGMPALLSYSIFRDIEACQYCWALKSADYPDIWAKAGYPPRISVSQIKGQIVHMALNKTITQLAMSNCTSVKDASSVDVLKEMSGLSTIINKCTEVAVDQLKDNPRIVTKLDHLRDTLDSQGNEIREVVQVILARVKLNPLKARLTTRNTIKAHIRFPLAHGSHSEVKLVAPGLKWMGIADLINITENNCEIVEFKTGLPREEDASQLLTYALLWHKDGELNPTGRLADQLSIHYPGTIRNIAAPSIQEAIRLEKEMVAKTSEINELVSSQLRVANVADMCRRCSVRHMCDSYWSGPVQELIADGNRRLALSDFQLKLTKKHGPRSWDGIFDQAGHHVRGPLVLLRTSQRESYLAIGDRVRVLDATVSGAEDDALTIQANISTECFVL